MAVWVLQSSLSLLKLLLRLLHSTHSHLLLTHSLLMVHLRHYGRWNHLALPLKLAALTLNVDCGGLILIQLEVIPTISKLKLFRNVVLKDSKLLAYSLEIFKCTINNFTQVKLLDSILTIIYSLLVGKCLELRRTHIIWIISLSDNRLSLGVPVHSCTWQCVSLEDAGVVGVLLLLRLKHVRRSYSVYW